MDDNKTGTYMVQLMRRKPRKPGSGQGGNGGQGGGQMRPQNGGHQGGRNNRMRHGGRPQQGGQRGAKTIDGKTYQQAQQAREKYLALARDALSAGDRVEAENYFQHADHYSRIINEFQEMMAWEAPQAHSQPVAEGESVAAEPVATQEVAAAVAPAETYVESAEPYAEVQKQDSPELALQRQREALPAFLKGVEEEKNPGGETGSA